MPLAISQMPMSEVTPIALSKQIKSQQFSPILNDLQLVGGVHSTLLQLSASPFLHTQSLHISGPGTNRSLSA